MNTLIRKAWEDPDFCSWKQAFNQAPCRCSKTRSWGMSSQLISAWPMNNPPPTVPVSAYKPEMSGWLGSTICYETINQLKCLCLQVCIQINKWTNWEGCWTFPINTFGDWCSIINTTLNKPSPTQWCADQIQSQSIKRLKSHFTRCIKTCNCISSYDFQCGETH